VRKPPLGYDVDNDGKYVINKKEAFIVRKIYEIFLRGYGYGKIAEELNNHGSRT
jgi:site-specific DNA recombinase